MLSAVLYDQKDLRIEDVPKPTISKDNALLRCRAVAICGTDMRIYRFGHSRLPSGTKRILGHELAGDFPKVPFQRSVVYKGNAQTWAYSHHQSITKFGDRYVASWSNGSCTRTTLARKCTLHGLLMGLIGRGRRLWSLRPLNRSWCGAMRAFTLVMGVSIATFVSPKTMAGMWLTLECAF